MGHPQWIEEVLVNYLSNAIKYGGTPPKIIIGANIGKAANVAEGMVRFYVRDYGPGISAKNQKRLFSKFERLDQVKTEGHGLGLSIVQRIIEKQGGEVGVESKNIIGEGSLFYFTLPAFTMPESVGSLDLPNSKKEVIPKSNTPTLAKAQWKEKEKLKTLIVENDSNSTAMLGVIVKHLSKKILYAGNGNEAVNTFRNNPDIDLILMDIQMPEMDGYTATRKIRELDSNVIIIVQTANVHPSERKKAIEAGCDDYISKPIIKNELLKIIDKCFRANRVK